MKKIFYLLSLIFVIAFIVNVKADMGAPSVIKYYVTVVNKDDAPCYDFDKNGKRVKSDRKASYGKEYYVVSEVTDNKYVYIENSADSFSCEVQLSDIMIKNNNFDIKSEGVEKIEEAHAIIFAKGGLNLRKGPAMSYSKIVTIPQYSVVTIRYRAGTYWYYAEYNGHKGWISGINGYFGYDSSDILYDIEDINIYNDSDKIIGKIPKYTEVTDYVKMPAPEYLHYKYYVNYNGVKGYVSDMAQKVDGEIKLLNDAYVYSGSKVIDKVASGDTVKYTVFKAGKNISTDNPYLTDYIFYIPSMKGVLNLRDDDEKKEYAVIKDENYKKLKGYIGEGLFGEKKEVKEDVQEEQEIVEIPDETVNNEKSNTKEIIIICILSSIIGALTCFIIIKLVNMKKDKKGDVSEKE